MRFHLFGFEIKIRKELAVLLILLLACAVFVIGFAITHSSGDIIIEAGHEADKIPEPSAGVQENAVPGEVKEAQEQIPEIKVYVVGCVAKPGIVTLKKGQMIADAIEAAGGATEEADLTKVNLVYTLKDNVMLHILSKNEMKDGAAGEAGSGVKIIRDDGGAVVNSGRQDTGVPGKVNINTASASELDTLPGIGEKTALDIIAYRESNGGFKKIEEIMNVPRIAEGRFNSLKDFICVE